MVEHKANGGMHTFAERSRDRNTSDISLPCINSPSTMLEVVMSGLTYMHIYGNGDVRPHLHAHIWRW